MHAATCKRKRRFFARRMWQDRKNVNTALQCRYFDALHARLRPHPRALTDVHVVVENY